MEREKLSGEALSGRQTAVAALVAGLSAVGALAGRVSWWQLLVCCLPILAAMFLSVRRMEGRGAPPRWLRCLHAGWGTLLAARALERGADRLVLTSGGSSRLWLVILLALPLLWMGWGKTAPFFRMVEVLWLAMGAVLALVLAFGLARLDWSRILTPVGTWGAAALGAGELFVPMLFLLPYIYKEQGGAAKAKLGWLSGLVGIAVALCLVTTGLLGGAAERIAQPFFTAAGLLGKTSRCEGLLSVLWLLPDLCLAGLLCRPWGARRWPALGAGLAAGLALAGITASIPAEIFAFGSLILLLLTLLFSGPNGKIVVKN